MSRNSVSEDAEFTELLRSVMADRARPAPPVAGWEPIRSQLQRVRRRRRLRSATRVGAGLLAVTAVIAVVNSRVGIGSIQEGPAQPLVGEPVRGSLRSNEAWLTALRRHVADSADISIGRGGGSITHGLPQWAPPSPDRVRVIFAGDLGGYRLALVAGSWEPSGRTDPGSRNLDLQRWYVGPAGAAVAALLPGNGSPSSISPSMAAQTIQPGSVPGSTEAMRRTGLAVAIVRSQAEAEVRLAGPAAYTAGGQATLPLSSASIAAAEPGVYAAPIPADGAYRLVVNGKSPVSGVLQEHRDPDERPPAEMKSGVWSAINLPIDFSRAVSGADPVLPDRLQPLRGGPTPPRDVLRYAFGRAALYSGLSTRDSTYRLLSARPGYGANGKVTEWTVVTVVTAPSGAHFVSACEVATGGRGIGPDPDGYLDAWKLAPSGSPDALALAWPVSGIELATVTPMGLIAIIGPRAAVTAEVLGPNGQVAGTVAVTGRVQAVDFNHKPLSKVRFLDAAGRTVAVTAVSAYAGGIVNAPVMSWPTSGQ